MARRAKLAAVNVNPAIEPVRYMKIPPFVEAYEITHSNLNAVAAWADANVSADDQERPVLILRKMPPPYNKGRVGDLVVKSESGDRRIASKDTFLDIYVVAPPR